MGTNAVLDYFYGKEADQFSFFTVPKILFTDDKYKGLPCEAKMPDARYQKLSANRSQPVKRAGTYEKLCF